MDRIINGKPLREILRLHADWRAGKDGGERADLIWVNLRGADLSELRTMQFDKWTIGYTHDTLQIGCQRHSIEKWARWDTEAGRKWVAQMDHGALEWAERNLGLVLAIIAANPADNNAKSE